MNLTLGYTCKSGCCMTKLISPKDVETELKKLYKRHLEAVIWESEDREHEMGGVTKGYDKWAWYYDTDIFNL